MQVKSEAELKLIEERFMSLQEDAQAAYAYFDEHPEAKLTVELTGKEARGLLVACANWTPAGAQELMTSEAMTSLMQLTDEQEAYAEETREIVIRSLNATLDGAVGILAAFRATTVPTPDTVPDWMTP